MILAELHDVIRMAIPGVVECLLAFDRSVRNAAIDWLSKIAANGTHHPSLPFDVLNHECSRTV